jgi:phosphatidylserine/phosphatidylglycerophosphate/cardiolipin synthase-like enzyme
VPSLRDVRVGIARTEPAHGERSEVREVEALYLTSIASARRWIYAENQYLTSEVVVAALADRLREPSGPEVVLVLPRRCPAWLEEASMGVLRTRAIRLLREADRHGRLRLYYPHIPGDACLNVHAKVMVIDDHFARVGSSNLANRSLALDTECDLAVESEGRPDLARGIAALRDDLLAEHLGTSEANVREELRRRDSLIAVIEALRGGERRLEPLPEAAPGWAVELILRTGLADPGKPSALAERVALRVPSTSADGRPALAWLALAVLVVAAALLLVLVS